jgi:ribosomal-protein-alanine N-acetyltransferase
MILPLSYQIETARLLLRIPNETDFPHIFSATRYKGFNDGMPWQPPNNLEELKAPLENSINGWKTGNDFSFSIDDKISGEFLGRISIRKGEEENVWDIGFWTHPKHQGKGIMSEACEAMLDLGFHMFSAKRIEACYAIWNKASEKILKKNGMEFVKHIAEGFQKNGVWIEENLLAIHLEEWNKIQELKSN